MALYSVTFREMFIHDFDDYDTYQTLYVRDFNLSATRNESIVAMVNGRRVSITTEGVSRVWNVGMPYAARTIADWLKENQGVPFLVRSPFGDMFNATINSVNRTEEALPGIVHDTPVSSISFVLTEIDE